MAIDPVCKMNVAPDKVDYAGQPYYFCSDACHKAFCADPQKYADIAHGGSQHHGHK